MKKEFIWLDKTIDIHRKHGLKEINISKLKEISKEDALKASEYLYKDYLANVGKVKGLTLFGEQLEVFDIDEKQRAMGALFEIAEKCGEKICKVKDVSEIAKNWDLPKEKVLKAYFKTPWR